MQTEDHLEQNRKRNDDSMYQFPIGVMVNSFRLPFRQAVEKAVDVGAKGIQMYTVSSEMSTENLTPSKRRELLDIIKSNGLVVSALCGDFGQGFGNSAKNPELIERSKRVLDLAKDFETDIVTTHIGVIPEDNSIDRYKIMQEACFELSRYADQNKAHFAIETGPERAEVLKEFLDSLDSRGVAVNLDPANLVMVTGDDPVKAVYTLKDYIVHTHAKDGIKLIDKSPEVIYGLVEEEIQSGEAFREVPLGTGGVDFVKYLAALDDIGYRGYLTIEREVGENPVEDIRTAVKYLENLLRES